ncbi:GntR family transcriptional regulator [Streptomyces sp. WM6378]|uniref:GntR family transcriptional regulator n=1 Tax=Streptomyces sp. WM6378 TaxID=1415557 RepID=UPI0006AFD6E5|nr:GntR family transcriptional regulator [Streptomyces sp. WM6378]
MPASPYTSYSQLAEALKVRIESGDLRAAARMPSENGLAQELGVSRGMVQRAYGALEREGILTRGQGQLWRIVGATADARSDVSYEDVAARIRLWLKDHPEQDVLPSGANLAREYEVSIDTVAQARRLLLDGGTLGRAGRRYVRAASGHLSRVDEVAQEIRTALAAEPDHVAPDGELIGEKAWMQRCAASKKTVQGALAKLETEGMVTAPRPGKGRRLVSR